MDYIHKVTWNLIGMIDGKVVARYHLTCDVEGKVQDAKNHASDRKPWMIAKARQMMRKAGIKDAILSTRINGKVEDRMLFAELIPSDPQTVH